MKIVIDGMGGDNAPFSTVKGCVDSINEFDIDMIITGDKDVLEKELSKYTYDKNKIEIVHTSEIIENEDKPVKAIKSKKNSSMVVALNLVKEKKADAIVCAGNTGALLAGGLFILGRMENVDRPALCTFMPTLKGMSLLLDAGANADCKPKNLLEFAVMSSVYYKSMFDKESPTVSIINIGEEEGKGNELTKKSYDLLKNSKLNFIGNIESRNIPFGESDIIVCDGFTGNVVLKLAEGVVFSMFSMLKDCFLSSYKTKIGAILLKDDLKKLKNRFDYSEYGGAPLLGVNGVLIKAHGSSNDIAIKNAIRQSINLAKNEVVYSIREKIKDLGADECE